MPTLQIRFDLVEKGGHGLRFDGEDEQIGVGDDFTIIGDGAEIGSGEVGACGRKRIAGEDVGRSLRRTRRLLRRC